MTFGDGRNIGRAAGVPMPQGPGGFLEHFEMSASVIASGVPLGSLRAPGNNGLTFVYQSFMDEIAHATGQDPVAFQTALLQQPRVKSSTPNDPEVDAERTLAVLRMVAEKAAWKPHRKFPAGVGRGLGVLDNHGAVGTVAQVRVETGSKVRVEKIWTVIDIGRQVVNPGAAQNMVEGGIIEAMSQMHGRSISPNGRAVQTNFNKYPLLRFNQAPAQVEVHFLKTDHPL